MEERTRLIQQLDQARVDMRAVVAAVNPEMEIYPGWTIKHVLAHIAGWDDATIAALRAHAGHYAAQVSSAIVKSSVE